MPVIQPKTFKICTLLLSLLVPFFAWPQLQNSQLPLGHFDIESTYREASRSNSIKNPNHQGFTGIVEAGYVVGGGYYMHDRMKLNLAGNYYVNHWLAMGLGTGLRFYERGFRSQLLYADARVYLGQRKAQVFFAAAAGASLTLSNNQPVNGVYTNVSIGSRVRLAGKNYLHLSFGYEAEKLPGYHGKVYVEGLSIGLGVSF